MESRTIHIMAICLAAVALAPGCKSFQQRRVGATRPVFQLRLVLDSPSADSEQIALTGKNAEHTHTETLNVQKTVLLDQTALQSAKSSTDALGQPVIDSRWRAQAVSFDRQELAQQSACRSGQVGVRLKASVMRLGGFVPKGHLTIARRFNAGEAKKGTPRPEGTIENTPYFQPSLRDGPDLRVRSPGVETPRYCRKPLRGKTAPWADRRFQSHPPGGGALTDSFAGATG